MYPGSFIGPRVDCAYGTAINTGLSATARGSGLVRRPGSRLSRRQVGGNEGLPPPVAAARAGRVSGCLFLPIHPCIRNWTEGHPTVVVGRRAPHHSEITNLTTMRIPGKLTLRRKERMNE